MQTPRPIRVLPLALGFLCACGLGLDLQSPDERGGLDASVLPDAPGVDAGETDAAEGCVAIAESCNGLDDDCDSRIDEDFDLSSDPLNCGACGAACFADPSGILECISGVCEVTDCGDGQADCNVDPNDGCEASLNTDEDCGACGNSCLAPSTCVAGRCGPTLDCGTGLTCMDVGTGCIASCGRFDIECSSPTSCTCTDVVMGTSASCVPVAGTGCALCRAAHTAGCCSP